MSNIALALARVVQTLWPTLRTHLLRLGRWVISRVRLRGAQAIAAYMLERAEGYQTGRLKNAVKKGWKRAANFRRAQIRRWKACASWLNKVADKLNAAVAKALEKLAIGERIPKSIKGA